MEFRQRAWLHDGVLAVLADHSVALALTDGRWIPRETRLALADGPTADFAYARLELTQADEPTGYSKAGLKKWAKTARDWEKSGDVFLYFISGAKERNPAAAMAMLDILKA